MNSGPFTFATAQPDPLEPELQEFRAVNTKERFTMDGSPGLERRLADLCQQVLARVQQAIPSRKLDALVLGGGYGRGQGGVLRTPRGDAPYNDLEFYVFMKGSRLLNERRFRPVLQRLEQELSSEAGLHVEFKIDSFPRLRRSPVTMYSYDLVAGHRTLFAPDGEFPACTHHLDPHRIPLHEATRLLMNRCTGLLMARELLQHSSLNDDETDFVSRNIAKAQLAIGDAILTAFGEYHWNCIDRHERLGRLGRDERVPFPQIAQHHAEGVEFKLHPRISLSNAAALRQRFATVSELARRTWLWVENRRLVQQFASTADYSSSRIGKSDECPAWRAMLVNARTFGPASLLRASALRYPRERLLNALPLLLWEDLPLEARFVRLLQNELRTEASDWQSLVAAYKAIWPQFS